MLSSDHFNLTHSHKIFNLNSLRLQRIISGTIRFHRVLKLFLAVLSNFCLRNKHISGSLLPSIQASLHFISSSHSLFTSIVSLFSLLFLLDCCQLSNSTQVVHLRSSPYNHVRRQLHGGHGQPVAPYCRDCRFAIPAC